MPQHLALVLDEEPASRRCVDDSDSSQRLTALSELIGGCVQHGIAWLTVRMPNAAADLRGRLEQWCAAQRSMFAETFVELEVIGAGLPAILAASVQPRLRVAVLLDGSGRAELAAAARAIATKVAAGVLSEENIDAACVRRHLHTAARPPIDLLVRTAGRQALGNTMLWHAAYAELLFMDVSGAQLRRSHLDSALNDYARRKRTFGALK